MNTHGMSLPHWIGRALGGVVLLCASASISCSNGPAGPAATKGFGVVTGDWDGRSWRGRGTAVIENGRLHLVGHYQDPRSHYDEYVIVATEFVGPGHYDIELSEGRLFKLIGGDAGINHDAGGVLNVVEYDAAGRRLRGTITLASTVALRPMQFTNGEFDVVVYDAASAVPRPPCRPLLGCLD